MLLFGRFPLLVSMSHYSAQFQRITCVCVYVYVYMHMHACLYVYLPIHLFVDLLPFLVSFLSPSTYSFLYISLA